MYYRYKSKISHIFIINDEGKFTLKTNEMYKGNVYRLNTECDIYPFNTKEVELIDDLSQIIISDIFDCVDDKPFNMTHTIGINWMEIKLRCEFCYISIEISNDEDEMSVFNMRELWRKIYKISDYSSEEFKSLCLRLIAG